MLGEKLAWHGSRQQPHRLRPECVHLAVIMDGTMVQILNRVARSQQLPGRNQQVIGILAAANLVLIQPCVLPLTLIITCAAYYYYFILFFNRYCDIYM